MIDNVKPTDRLVFDLHMYQIDYNQEKEKTLRKEIAAKYGVPERNVEINFIPITVSDTGEHISLASDVIDSIQDPEFHVSLYEEYMRLKEIKDVNLEDIKVIDQRVNALIDLDQYSKYKPYTFKYVKWSNYLSYGPDNYFDFTGLRGLVLLTSNPGNQGGKTTFAVDLLRFALFGKAVKSPTLDSVFNSYLPEATEVMVEACIEIDGYDYVIRRTVTRPAQAKRTSRSKPKQTVEYFKVVDGSREVIENCEGESSVQTNNIIRESIGTVEDFNLVISATKKSLTNLLEMGQTDKGKVFSRWLGLLSIEKKEEIAKDLWKNSVNPTLKSNRYDRATLSKEVEQLMKSIEDYNVAKRDGEAKLKDVSEKISENEKNKTLVMGMKRQVKDELVKADVTTIETSISRKESELENKRAEMRVMKEEYATLKDVTFSQEEYDGVVREHESKKSLRSMLDVEDGKEVTKINFIDGEIAKIRQLMEQKVCPNCGQPIDNDLQSGQIAQLEEKRRVSEGERKRISGDMDKVKGEIEVLKKKGEALLEDKAKVEQLARLKLKMIAVKENIDRLKLEIADLRRRIEEIESNKENIQYNNELDIRIANIETTLTEFNKVKEGLIRDVEGYSNTITYSEKEVKSRNEIIDVLKEEEKTIRNWALYQELVGKNGIVKIVLRKALPIINNEMHRILNGICNFDVVLEIDDKNNVCVNIVNDGVKMDLSYTGSGMEETFASLALRSALASIASIAKPSFLVLDEIDAGIHEENYENLHELYKRIEQNYQFILHIIHNENMYYMHDSQITVVKHGHVSRIESTSSVG